MKYSISQIIKTYKELNRICVQQFKDFKLKSAFYASLVGKTDALAEFLYIEKGIDLLKNWKGKSKISIKYMKNVISNLGKMSAKLDLTCVSSRELRQSFIELLWGWWRAKWIIYKSDKLLMAKSTP